ncbi:MAG TPA: hypothetical protein VFL91_14595 [Thermomicrobiales bacterium]|nr:hypothetical protein [Thermomicrobiales bacterium]
MKKTGDPDCMIEATCRPMSADTAPKALADDLERRWREDICQGFYSWEAHALAISDEAVTLDFVAVHDGDRRYITGKIVIDLRPRPGKKAKRGPA